MDEDDDEPVPLPNVNAAILKKVHPFCYFANGTSVIIYVVCTSLLTVSINIDLTKKECDTS